MLTSEVFPPFSFGGRGALKPKHTFDFSESPKAGPIPHFSKFFPSPNSSSPHHPTPIFTKKNNFHLQSSHFPDLSFKIGNPSLKRCYRTLYRSNPYLSFKIAGKFKKIENLKFKNFPLY